MIDRRARRLPTSVPIPVDPQFVQTFCEGGWARCDRIYGKRRTQTWASAIGRDRLRQMRREHLMGRKG